MAVDRRIRTVPRHVDGGGGGTILLWKNVCHRNFYNAFRHPGIFADQSKTGVITAPLQFKQVDQSKNRKITRQVLTFSPFSTSTKTWRNSSHSFLASILTAAILFCKVIVAKKSFQRPACLFPDKLCLKLYWGGCLPAKTMGCEHGFFTDRNPTSGSGQDYFKISRCDSGRVGSGRVGSGRVIFEQKKRLEVKRGVIIAAKKKGSRNGACEEREHDCSFHYPCQ